jgi:transcriptional regulator with XRE-family HTH domain/ribosomal protein S21
MKTDAEVQIMLRERHKGKTQEQAAARSGMHPNTARKYERRGALPSQLKQPRTYRTRSNPFEADWPWVQAHLERDPALQADTLFAELCRQHPERYQPGQLRTLQRHIARWRALYGPDCEVMFAQVHHPGVRAETDFTHLSDLGVTLAEQPFPHLLYHLVLTYSNVEAVQLCFSESFESLAEGLESCLWQLGGLPLEHRTDNLSAAVQSIEPDGSRRWTDRYQALMEHYGLRPTTNQAGIAHENGDVEQAHHRFKRAVDQALRLRGSRDFPSRDAYVRFLQTLLRERNQTRQARWAEERAALRPLPLTALHPCREFRLTVTPSSTITVLRNTYSVPSRLIGTLLTVRVRAEVLELYVGTSCVLTLPRLHGRQQQCINYRHISHSLLRKPGAFANYRYRDELFPSLIFRQAYDRLLVVQPTRADKEYVGVLHLAATTSEADVEAALTLLLDSNQSPTLSATRALVLAPTPHHLPALQTPSLDLARYDQLLVSGGVA